MLHAGVGATTDWVASMMLLALGLMNVQAESVCLLKSGCIRGIGILLCIYIYIYVQLCICIYVQAENLNIGVTNQNNIGR